jgi:hypothetical protein
MAAVTASFLALPAATRRRKKARRVGLCRTATRAAMYSTARTVPGRPRSCGGSSSGRCRGRMAHGDRQAALRPRPRSSRRKTEADRRRLASVDWRELASVTGPRVSIPAARYPVVGFGLLSAVGAVPLTHGVQSRSSGRSRDAQSSTTLLPDKRPGPISRPDDGTSCRAGDGTSRPKLSRPPSTWRWAPVAARTSCRRRACGAG